MEDSSKPRKTTFGFILAVVASVFVLLNGILWLTMASIFRFVITEAIFSVFSSYFVILGTLAIAFAIIMFIGALIIYWYKDKKTGGRIVLVFSILSVGTGGGFLLGFALGAIGGASSIGKL